MKQDKLKYFIALVLIFSSVFVLALKKDDEKENLLKKKAELEKEIAFTNKLLDDTRSKQKNSVQELKLVETKIRQRNRLIAELNNEIGIIDKEIQEKTTRLQSLKGELERTRKEYSDLIYHAFKNKNRNLDLMYLLASKDISQLYSRFIYLQQYKDYRSRSIQLIIKLKQIIEVELIELNLTKEEKVNTINKVLAEKALLVSDREQVDEIMGNLKQQESKLQQELKQKKKLKEKIEKQIEEIIRKESKNKSYKNLTPAEKIISDDFMKNKGGLPWPTEMGVITGQFGEHPHPVIRNLMIRNHGIDITTVPSSKARAVFKGVVTKVFTIKGANSTVIIRHGNFYTVYHNLEEVYVKAGDAIDTKDYIGKIFTDTAKGECVFHFEIWKELEKQNPEDWLSN